MIDYMGNPLEKGDTVIFISPGYRDFTKGTIVRFTKCYVIVSYKPRNSTLEYEIKQTPDQLIKV